MASQVEQDVDPIAIVGMGCRLPGAANPTSFWELLCRGEDRVTEFPKKRLDATRFYDPKALTPGKSNTKWGAFLDDVEGFDWRAFGISPREAAAMDPQHRLLLEVAWEALEDAGAPLESVAGTRTGVVLGLMLNDYRLITRGSLTECDGFTVAANAPSFAANRISFHLDLKGTSFTLDAACASSLVALHVACELIRSGELEGALVGAASLLLAPDAFISLSRASALSPTGRSRTMDRSADGFVRGEGAGVVYLKPLRAALANGDRIYAVIAGTSSAHKGASNWIQEPSRASQRSVIEAALRKAGVQGKDLDYVELHGTGTPRGDPEEAAALGSIVSEGRDPSSRCLIGSVKTNIGHLDPAAGIAGLIKVALSIHHGLIPPSLHFTEFNPLIDGEALHLEVGTTLRPWPRGANRVAGVTSIGFGGVCGHAILRSSPPSEAPAETGDGGRRAEFIKSPAAHILPLSARSPAALTGLAVAVAAELKTVKDHASLHDICYTLARRRSHHDHRLCVVGADADALARALSAFARGEACANLYDGASTAPPESGERPSGHEWREASLRSESTDVGMSSLERVARLYCDGQSVDWSTVVSPGCVVSTPAYPWQRARLWLPTPAKYGLEASPVADARVHPFVTTGVEVPEPAGHVWDAAVDLKAHAYFLDHRPQGKPTLPAAAFVEMMLWAASSLAPLASIVLEDIRFHKAVFLTPESVVRFSIKYTPSDAGGRFQVFSKASSGWVENVTAVLAKDADATPEATFNVGELEVHLCRTDSMDREECYDEIAQKGLDMGPAFRRIDRASQATGSIIAKILNVDLEEARPFLIHPAVADACAHLMFLGLPAARHAGYLPVRIDRLRFHRSPQLGTLFSRTSVVACDEGGKHTFVGRADVFDGDGKAVFEMSGVELADLGAERATTPDALERWCYGIEWRPLASREPTWTPSGTWVVWLDFAGIGARLAEQLSRAGCRVIEVTERDSDLVVSAGRVHVARGDLESVRSQLEGILDNEPDLAGFVYLGGMNDDVEHTPLQSVDDASWKVWQPVLAIAQTLLHSPSSDAKLWVVTRGAHDGRSPVQAALWGLGRSLVFDLSDHWGGIVDIEDDTSGAVAADILVSAMATQFASGEELLFRGGNLLSSRLVPLDLPVSGDRGPLCVSRDGLYVVTGGLGGLGLSAAERLVDRGARHVALVGRTPLPERSEWARLLSDPDIDARLRRQLSTLVRFEACGVDARVHILDVGDAVLFASWLEEVQLSTNLPIRGFVHAAGVFDVLALDEVTDAAFMRQMRPKCMPLLALERVVPPQQLEFLALFSSAASVINSPRAAHYAAANAFLDGFAQRARGRGVHAVSLNWGVWAEVGFIERIDRRSGTRLHEMESIPPKIGVDLFEHFLVHDVTQVLVWPSKWEQWAKTYPSLSSVPLFSDRVSGLHLAPDARGGDDAWLDRFVDATGDARRLIVQSFLRRRIEGLLQLPLGEADEIVALEDLGLDSLSSIELRTQIQRTFRVDLSAFEFLAGANLISATAAVVRTFNEVYPELPPHAALPDRADLILEARR
jgi:acyl transferase domain-containing protein/acyl carrier protein